MFLVKWFWNALSSLGLSSTNARILFLGLDNAGKTTLLHMLRDNKLISHEPTRHPQCEELTIGNVKFKSYDLGGHKAARRLWSQYCTNVDGIVYLVDASDQKRIGESQKELDKLLSDTELRTVPFLILGNKIDKKEALSEDEFREELGLKRTTGKDVKKVQKGVRPIEVFMCSIIKRAGYTDGFRWLSNFLE